MKPYEWKIIFRDSEFKVGKEERERERNLVKLDFKNRNMMPRVIGTSGLQI